MNIVFMGSPEFAIPSLDKIHQSHHTISAVVSNVDKRRGRGSDKAPTPVKAHALALGLNIIEVESLSDSAFENALKELNADLFVVVAFRVLPKKILDIPKIGSINLHASLLPKYRGAAPIHWAVINGEHKTGCTIFFLDEKVDTGNILLQETTEIKPNETTGDVYNRLMELGSEKLLEAINMIEEGDYSLAEQNDLEATPAPKLFNENTRLDFTKTVEEVHNKIRGLNPFPIAWTTWNNEKVKIYQSEKIYNISQNPGKIIIKDDNLLVGCKDGAIAIKLLQLPGKKKMNAQEFINGFAPKGYFK